MHRDFSQAKPGDVFAVASRGASYSRATVERVTKTMVITDKGRFKLNGGFRVGADQWDSSMLVEMDNPNVVAGFALQRHRNLTAALIKATEDYRSNPTSDKLTDVQIAAQKVSDNNYTPDA